MSVYDAIVIGGGPAGITAALYLVRSGASVALIEKLTPGGQVLATESIENYPGFPKGIKGWELADNFAAHLEGLSLDRFSAAVQSVDKAETGLFSVHFDASTTDVNAIEGRTVLVCSGSSHRKMGLENELKLAGHGVSYCAICDGNFFRGQNVAVVGGGNTAMEEALYLSKIVNKVYLIHRREDFRGAKTYLDRLEASPAVEIIRNHVVAAIHGNDALTGLTLQDVRSGESTELAVEGFFVFVGILPNVDFVPHEVERDAHGFLVTDTEMRTNVAGFFAAGDIRSKLCRQVSTAVGDGATAAQAAFLYLEQGNV